MPPAKRRGFSSTHQTPPPLQCPRRGKSQCPQHGDALSLDENLCRAELTPAQRAAAVKRRKQIWEALHPEGGKTVSTPGGKQQIAFAADTAKSAGMTKRAINQHLSRAEALGEDLQAVSGTSLDRGVELDALKVMPEPERKQLIERARAGEKVSARSTAVSSLSGACCTNQVRELTPGPVSRYDGDITDFIALLT